MLVMLCANTQLRRLVYNLMKQQGAGREHLVKVLPNRGWQELTQKIQKTVHQAQHHRTTAIIAPTVLLIPRQSSRSPWLDTIAYMPKSEISSPRGVIIARQSLLLPPGSRIHRNGNVKSSSTPPLSLSFQQVRPPNALASHWLVLGEGKDPISQPTRVMSTPLKPAQFQRAQRILSPLESLWQQAP
jgi:hypothetical protein